MALARRLNRDAGGFGVPPLIFLTDPARTPQPETVVRSLPPDSAVIYRHFGAADRLATARRLAHLCQTRRLKLLIAADPSLAAMVGAHGVHWPEARLPACRDARFEQETASAHGADAVWRAQRFGASLCLLGPVFPTRSTAANPPLGLFGASQIARAASVPVLALGGINQGNARLLAGRGFAGLAAIDVFVLNSD